MKYSPGGLHLVEYGYFKSKALHLRFRKGQHLYNV